MLLGSLIGWNTSFIVFFLAIAIVLVVDLIISYKAYSKASLKIKNTGMVTFYSVGIAVVGLIWLFTGIYKCGRQADIADYNYDFFLGIMFIAYSIWCFFKYRYACVITDNYVYIAITSFLKKIRKDDVEISESDGTLKIYTKKKNKTYVFVKEETN